MFVLSLEGFHVSRLSPGLWWICGTLVYREWRKEQFSGIRFRLRLKCLCFCLTGETSLIILRTVLVEKFACGKCTQSKIWSNPIPLLNLEFFLPHRAAGTPSHGMMLLIRLQTVLFLSWVYVCLSVFLWDKLNLNVYCHNIQWESQEKMVSQTGL